MEKTNARGRRNGSPSEGHTPDATAQDILETGGAIATADSPGTAEARQRIEQNAGGKGDRGTAPRGLQETFIDERNDVLAVINELEDQLDRHQEIRETLEREMTTTNEKLQTANQRVQELEWQVVTLQTRVDALDQLRNEVTSLEEELSDVNARAQRAAEQLNLSQKDNTRLRTELKAANKQADELFAVRKERDGLRTEQKTLSARVEELERMQRETIEERIALQSQLQDLHIAISEMTEERNKLQLAARAADDRIRELTQVQGALDDKIEALRDEKKTLQVQIAHLERENMRLVEQRQFYECEVTSLRNQARTAESALASVKKAFTEVRTALTETKSRARRRTLDTWPRIGSTLRGLTTAEIDGGAPTAAHSALVTAGTDAAAELSESEES
ncbi:MAG: hypothetical protein IPM18_08460 [Phycisphaerales bacterium]|nr:hypothetical protein [Phycisphaerales bacterium]